MNYTKEFRKGEMLKSQTQVKLYPLQSKVIPESKFSPPLSRPPSIMDLKKSQLPPQKKLMTVASFAPL